jgi:heme oxygenase (staphylobilin-producing)
MQVEKGHSAEVAERFKQPRAMDEMDGLIDVSVMINKRSKDEEEVVAVIRWESEEAWKAWEKSPAHIAGHKDKKARVAPPYIISTTVNLYHAEVARKGKAYNAFHTV